MNTENRLHIHMGCGESLQSRRWLLRLAAIRDNKAQRAPARRKQTRHQARNRS